MKKLKVAVVGVGLFGEFHARTFRGDERVQLVAVVDTNRKRARQIAKTLGCKAYFNTTALLESESPDLVSIATPDGQHEPVATACADAGADILLEKPMASTLREADNIIRAVEKQDVKLMIDHVLRFDPRYQKARELVSEGSVGKIVLMSSWRNAGFGIGREPRRFSDLCRTSLIHDIDAARWLGGSEVRSVFGRAVATTVEGVTADDAVTAIMEFEDGSMSSMETCWVLPEKYPSTLDSGLRLVGTKGAINISSKDQGIEVSVEDTFSFPDLTYFPVVAGKVVGALKESLGHMVDCVLHDKDPAVGGEDGRRALEIALAIRKSISTKKPVEIRR